MILELIIIMSSKILCAKPNVVFKHFMVSATYVPSQDVLEQQTNGDSDSCYHLVKTRRLRQSDGLVHCSV